jgi:hypothetical protein
LSSPQSKFDDHAILASERNHVGDSRDRDQFQERFEQPLAARIAKRSQQRVDQFERDRSAAQILSG